MKIQNKEIIDIKAFGKKYIMEWERNEDGNNYIMITECSKESNEIETLEAFDFKEVE